MTAAALQGPVTDALDGVLKAAMGGAGRQFGAVEATGLETAREVHPKGFGLGWPKPEADDLSLCPSLLVATASIAAIETIPASLVGFGVCGVQSDVGPVAVSGRSRNALPRSAISLHSLDTVLLDMPLTPMACANASTRRVDTPPLQASWMTARSALSIPVSPGRARVCPFVPSSTDRAVAIGFHDPLRNRLGNAAKKIATVLLGQKLGKVHVGFGHRGLLYCRG